MHKFYTYGDVFIEDNFNFLNTSPLETAFFFLNAVNINELNRNTFIYKV